MDDPDSDRELLFATARQFRVTNILFSRYRHILNRYLLDDMARRADRPGNGNRFSVIDIGAGGCDVALWLVRAACARGLDVRVTCVDHDSRLVAFARRRIEAAGFGERVDVLRLEALEVERLPDADYSYCGNTLHHLSRKSARCLLGLMERKSRCRYLLTDLERSAAAWIAYWLFSALFLRGSFARYDGLVSISRAFTRTELARLVSGERGEAAATAGANLPAVNTLFPARLTVIGQGRAREAAGRPV